MDSGKVQGDMQAAGESEYVLRSAHGNIPSYDLVLSKQEVDLGFSIRALQDQKGRTTKSLVRCKSGERTDMHETMERLRPTRPSSSSCWSA
eukprot:8521211-Pyramimonas_sp.AAC.1